MSTPPPETPQPPSGYPQQPYGFQPAPTPTKTGNGLGLAALIVGGVAFIGAFVPFVNYLTGFVAFVGLVLGIIAIFLKNRKRLLAIIGAAVSFVALTLSIILATVYTAGFAGAVSDSLRSAAAESSASSERTLNVVYEVTGDATDSSITYSIGTAGSSGTEQANGQPLPFSKEFTVSAGGTFDASIFSVVALNGPDDAGDITCTITVDGEVVAQQTSTGAYASVSCSSSTFDLDDSE